ncbi:MAG: hypothetical protein JRI68_29340 [Deltaproteobacteria bacterium]|nr:hypothetical protein [Deltaproteobacteria bacterium]
MLFVLVAVALASACTWLGWSHARRVAGLCDLGTHQHIRELRRRPLEERLAWLQTHSSPNRWEHALGRALTDEPDPRQQLVVVNETVAGLEHRLEASQGWPRGAAWICAGGCALTGLAGYLSMGLQAVLLWILVPAVAGIVACVAAGRHGRRQLRRARDGIDGLIEALVGELGAVEVPQRRQMRWRRRRGRR